VGLSPKSHLHPDTLLCSEQLFLCHNKSMTRPTPSPPDHSAAAEQLLSAFQQRRPLRVGSLIITIFGDALTPRGGVIALGSLIRLVERFGIDERWVRTSVGRLADDHWLDAHRVGRRAEYALSESGRTRFAEATRRIYAGPPTLGGDQWTFVALPPASKGDRQPLREVLRVGGFGEINEGLYAHPCVTPEETQAYLADHDGSAPLIFQSQRITGLDPAELVTRAWDLSALGQRYRQFCDQFAPIAEALPTLRTADPALAFVVRTLLIHEYRRIHLRDPMVPASLLPADYPGHTAYELCREIYHALFSPAEHYLDANAERLDGPLPPPDDTIGTRFPVL
jgi:phenylacetic acid degradation operon negative regulatory protein